MYLGLSPPFPHHCQESKMKPISTEINDEVIRLIDLMSAQEANAFDGDPNITYDKIIKACNYNMDVVAEHFEYASGIDEPRF